MELNNRELRIIAVNVNSIITNEKRYGLLKFIEQNNPDILLLNETKLNPKHKITFENYSCIRTDRPNALQGGGTAILFRKQIAFISPISFSPLPNSQILETTAIKINCSRDIRLIIICAYAPGHNNISFTAELNNLYTQNNILENNTFFVIAGDLNARHPDYGDSTSNSRCGYLQNWLATNAIEYRPKLYAPYNATYPKANSYRDVCLADSRPELKNLISDKLITLEYDSDHRAIAFALDLNSINTQLDIVQIINYPYNYKKANWQKFSSKFKQLSENIDIPNEKNLSNDEIDKLLKKT